jgi:hypothetical protein
VFALRAQSPAPPRAEENVVPDIRETMAQLDRRLAELRDQISDLVTEPEAPPPLPSPAASSVALPTAAELERAYAGRPGSASGGTGPQSSQTQAAADAVGQLGAQIKELLTIRERLLGDAEQLLAGYERRLRELESPDSAELEQALAWLARSPGRSETPVGVSEFASRPAFFEGLMTIAVAGVHRIQTIQVLEDSLSRVRHVERVYIRRWHAGQLLVELTLSAGVELVGELNRVLPFPFAVRSATGHEIAITLEGER